MAGRGQGHLGAGRCSMGAAGCRQVQQDAASRCIRRKQLRPAGWPGAAGCALSCIRKKRLKPVGCSRAWQGAGRGSWAQAGAAWVRQGAARCSRMQPVVVLGGNSFGQQGAAGRGRVRAGGGSWAQPGAAQGWPGAAGCGLSCIRKKQLRPAGCRRVRLGAGGVSWAQAGAAWVPPGAARCSESFY